MHRSSISYHYAFEIIPHRAPSIAFALTQSIPAPPAAGVVSTVDPTATMDASRYRAIASARAIKSISTTAPTELQQLATAGGACG